MSTESVKQGHAPSPASGLDLVPPPDLHRSALDGAPDAIVVLDHDGIILAWNRAASALLGHDAAEVVGAPVDLILTVPDGGLDLFLGDPPDAVEAGGRRFLPLVAADGRTLTCEITIGVAPAPCRLFVCTLRDATLAFAGLGDVWDGAEERLGSLAANMPGIIFQRVMQPDGTIYYPFFSAGVRDLLGYEPEDMRLARDGCIDAIHWADRDRYMQAMRRSAQDLCVYTEEFRAIAASGEVKWLSGTARPERMPNGDILWDGVLIDVTDRMRAEQRLEMIMDHAADCIITIGESGLVETVNAATTLTFGYAESELIGRNVSVLMPPVHRDRHQSYIRRYLGTGESSMLGAGARELEGQRKDGTVFPIELALSEVLSEGRRVFIAVLRDITARKETERALHETEQRLRTIADNINGMVFQRILEADGSVRYTYVNEGAKKVAGIDPEEMLADASLFLDRLNPDDRAAFMEALSRSARSLEPVEMDVRVIHRSGEERWLRSWSRPRRLDDGRMAWDGVALDVTDRKRAEERLMFLAYYDPMTGLGNRTLFLERFHRARAQANRTQSWIGFLSLGLDRFSIINATLGHSVGDRVLKAVAERLQGCCGSSDVLCRAGGDRFMVLLTGIATLAEMFEAVERIHAAFAQPIAIDGQEFDLTLSIGGSLYPRDGDSAETLIMHADAALNRAKAQGPGSFQLFSEEMGQRAVQTLAMQARLRRAIENREFVAFFQPQVDVRTGAFVGMEALARWQSPDRGLVPPGEFIPVAEEFGLIDAICEQVLDDACRWTKAWHDAGLPQVPVAVNISGRQFHNSRRLLQTVEDALAATGLDPRFLELELTESSAMTDPENAIAVVRQLRDRGVASSIDDFGTGYSSLSVLKRFPIRKLKIDRSFVLDVTTDMNDAAIVCAMIAMANALNLKVVAEGVETMEHLDFLHGVGCDSIQGYLVAKPLPAAEMEALFRKGPPLKPR
ncbi:bifunctional diguanylate cyclase/phosphodiesterase [Caenispirillum bisanense]|uniref:bifunctional diguanylate cyclase/phosphodiesterase n=1 Tax=Caenispirillum bisanense TaxID=414052 RepID=UPI0031E20F86